MKIFFNSSIGYAATVTVCEWAGALAGAYAFSGLSASPSHYIAPILLVGGIVAYKTHDVAKTIFTLAGGTFYAYAREPIHEAAGTILGGYAGRVLFKAPTTLWDEEVPSRSYTVCMLRYLGTGHLFDLAIRTSSLPILGFVFNIPRQLIKSGMQTVAYSAPTIWPIIKRRLIEKKIDTKIVAPILYQVLHNRFGRDASHNIARAALSEVAPAQQALSISLQLILPPPVFSITRFFFQNYTYPLRLTKGVEEKTIDLLTPLLAQFLPCQKIEHTMQNSLTLLLRSIHSYLKVTQQYTQIDLNQTPLKNAKDLSAALADNISNPHMVCSFFFDKSTETVLKEWTNQFIQWKTNFEIKHTGFTLTDKLNEHLEAMLPIYLKYYGYHLMLYQDQFKTELSISEEEDLLLEIIHLLMKSFVLSIGAHPFPWFLQKTLIKCTKIFQATLGTALKAHYNIIAPPEETAYLNERIAMQEYFVVKPEEIKETPSSAQTPLPSKIFRPGEIELPPIPDRRIRKNEVKRIDATHPQDPSWTYEGNTPPKRVPFARIRQLFQK